MNVNSNLSLPPAKLVDYWVEMGTQNETKVDVENEEIEIKAYILTQVVELAQEINQLLGKIPRLLRLSDQAGLVLSITIPLPDKSMAPFVVRDLRTSHFFPLETFTQFRWGRENTRSIAGYCATFKKPVFIKDLTDPKEELRKYWVPSLGLFQSREKESSILAIPLCSTLQRSGTDAKTCIAVLSISALDKEVLKKEHISVIQNLAEWITRLLINSTILPTPDILRDFFYKLSTSSAAKNDDPGFVDFSEPDKIIRERINELLVDLGTGKSSGKKALKAKKILQTFLDVGESGIALNDLSHFFEVLQ